MRQRKRRAAKGFREAAFLHRRVVADLADRLEAIPRPFSRALALGGGGLFSAEVRARPDLSARIGEIVEADIASGIEIDPEHLPFAEESFDLVVSPLLLHTVNDLPGALIQIRRILKPDGLMLASFFGGDTLTELRVALIEAESQITGGAGPRVAPFADLQDVAGLLQRAGFALPAADRDIVTVRYGEPMQLLADVRAMGETAALADKLETYHPKAPHAHLVFLGVATNAQGRGVGSELLKHTLASLDASGTVAYLECSTERNVALYQRHGFEVTGQFELPNLHMWTMARQPRR